MTLGNRVSKDTAAGERQLSFRADLTAGRGSFTEVVADGKREPVSSPAVTAPLRYYYHSRNYIIVIIAVIIIVIAVLYNYRLHRTDARGPAGVVVVLAVDGYSFAESPRRVYEPFISFDTLCYYLFIYLF